MSNLRNQIEEEVRKKRERSERPGRKQAKETDEAGKLLDGIRPRLDELSHATDKYSLKVDYAKGPYSSVIAVVELDDIDGAWVAAWQVAATVGGSVFDWEVTCNPHGVDTRHAWFKGSDDVLNFLTASIAERIVEMETGED